MAEDILKQARLLWDNKQEIEAGRLLFSCIPIEKTPAWGNGVLVFIYRHLALRDDLVASIISCASDHTRWKEARSIFLALRRQSLELNDIGPLSREEDLRQRLLSLAQVVAKVVYNASGPPDPFDSNAGWWIPYCLRQLLDAISDETVARDAWSLLCDFTKAPTTIK